MYQVLAQKRFHLIATDIKSPILQMRKLSPERLVSFPRFHRKHTAGLGFETRSDRSSAQILPLKNKQTEKQKQKPETEKTSQDAHAKPEAKEQATPHRSQKEARLQKLQDPIT